MAAKTRKPRTRRPKQTSIPGTEGPRVAEIDRAAEAYVYFRDERIHVQKDETLHHDKLLELMVKHHLPDYEYDGKIVRLVHGATKVKVKRKADADDVEANGEE